MRERVVGLEEEEEEDIWAVAEDGESVTVVGRHAGVCLVPPARPPSQGHGTSGIVGNGHVERL